MFWSIARCIAVFFFGLVCGYSLSFITDTQKHFIQGRESVLNEVVTIGMEDGPCSVGIPLSVLVDMVNVGVIDWHNACSEALEQ